MAMGTAAAITAGVSGAMGIGQTISGIIGKNKAKKALDNLDVPELNNAFEGVSISTEGSDIMREEAQRTSAMLIDNAKAGGVRSAMGNAGRISAINNATNREARAYIDDQIIQKEYAVAEDNARIRGVLENRYQGEVAGLGQAMQANRQDIFSGIRGIGSSIMYAGRNFESNQDGGGVNPNSYDPSYMFNTVPSFGFDNASLYQNNPSAIVG